MGKGKYILAMLLILLGGIVAAMNACSNVKLQGAIANPKTVSIRIKNYCPQTGFYATNVSTLAPYSYDFANAFVINASAAVTPQGFAPSLSRDGLGDAFKGAPEN